MYKVCFKEFVSFDSVVDYAWTEYKIDLADLDTSTMTEEEKQEACHELDCIINDSY